MKMRIKNPQKRIEELNKIVTRLKNMIYLNNRFVIKSFRKYDIKNKNTTQIIQTLNGQARFLDLQKMKLIEERYSKKQLAIELIHLYNYIESMAKSKS